MNYLAIAVVVSWALVLLFQSPIENNLQYVESFVNKQAAAAYQNFKSKSKLVKDGKDLKNIIEIGNKIEKSVTSFFKKRWS